MALSHTLAPFLVREESAFSYKRKTRGHCLSTVPAGLVIGSGQSPRPPGNYRGYLMAA